MEALRVRRAGFPNRLIYRTFLLQFRLLLGSHNNQIDEIRKSELNDRQLKEICRNVLRNRNVVAGGIDATRYQLGITKIFLRADVLHSLNSIQEKMMERSVIKIQRAVRVYIARITYERRLKGALLVQRIVRGMLARREHQDMLNRHAEARARRIVEERIQKEKKEKEEKERLQKIEMQNIDLQAQSLLQEALSTFERLQHLKGPENELLGEPDVVTGETNEFCDALEAVVGSVERCQNAHTTSDAKTYMRAVRETLRILKDAEVVGERYLSLKQEAHRIKVEQRKREEERIARENKRIQEDQIRQALQREANERARMRAEEEYTLFVDTARRRLERENEERTRMQMEREEKNRKYILKERKRIEKLKEQRNLAAMQKEELQQKSIMREQIRRIEIEKRRKIAEEANRKKQAAMEHARTIQKDRDVGSNELTRMRKEEYYLKNVDKILKEKYIHSRDRLRSIIRTRERRELELMCKEEKYQRGLIELLWIAELDRKNAERERMRMQNEDLASRMWSLQRSLGGHINKIINHEIALDLKSKEESTSAFAEMRRIVSDLEQHTSEVKHAHEVRSSSRQRKRMENRAGTIDFERSLGYNQGKVHSSSATKGRTEKTIMEMEDKRSTLVFNALHQLAQSGAVPGVVLNGNVVQNGNSARHSSSPGNSMNRNYGRKGTNRNKEMMMHDEEDKKRKIQKEKFKNRLLKKGERKINNEKQQYQQIPSKRSHGTDRNAVQQRGQIRATPAAQALHLDNDDELYNSIHTTKKESTSNYNTPSKLNHTPIKSTSAVRSASRRLRLRESAMKAAKDATNANESNGATAADASAAVKTEEELDWNVFSRLQNHQSIKRKEEEKEDNFSSSFDEEKRNGTKTTPYNTPYKMTSRPITTPSINTTPNINPSHPTQNNTTNTTNTTNINTTNNNCINLSIIFFVLFLKA